MKRKISILSATALILGVTILAASAWAGSLKIPVWGTDTSTITDPGVQWVDDDGVLHYRGTIMVGEIAGQDIDGQSISGVSVSVITMDLDTTTGNGSFETETRIDDVAYGDLNGAWAGKLRATITGFVYDGTYNLPHGYGDLDGWHDRGTWNGVVGSGFINWDGIFHIPGGGHGNKAYASENRTLSSVKALFE